MINRYYCILWHHFINVDHRDCIRSPMLARSRWSHCVSMYMNSSIQAAIEAQSFYCILLLMHAALCQTRGERREFSAFVYTSVMRSFLRKAAPAVLCRRIAWHEHHGFGWSSHSRKAAPAELAPFRPAVASGGFGSTGYWCWRGWRCCA